MLKKMEEIKLNNLFKAMLATIKSQRGAIGVYFGGRRLIRPQAYTVIDDSGMYARGLGGGNTLALIGECTGGQPGVIQWFTDPSYAKAILRSGPLLQAVQRAYSPSAEINGAYLMGAIRVNPATSATLTLLDSNSNPALVLTSVDSGIRNNQIRARIESATTGKRVTFTYGTNYDQGDNVGKASLNLACADPLAISALCSVAISTNSKLLTTTVQSYAQDRKSTRLNSSH
jgi:hypothetical protein